MRIFLAGASGVIGQRLVPLLAGAGHVVAGMTRTEGNAGLVAGLGAEPVVCDVFDAAALNAAVAAFGPDIVMHQLTDLPDDAGQITEFGRRNARIRGEGTRNLIAAASAKVIAQSISWELPTDQARAVTAEHERQVLAADGVVIRYGQFCGPGTYYPAEQPAPPRIHIDDAARLTLDTLAVPGGITVVIDDRAGIDGST